VALNSGVSAFAQRPYFLFLIGLEITPQINPCHEKRAVFPVAGVVVRIEGQSRTGYSVFGFQERPKLL
jgi:hypothetical protein